jgi:hypothetical protein
MSRGALQEGVVPEEPDDDSLAFVAQASHDSAVTLLHMAALFFTIDGSRPSFSHISVMTAGSSLRRFT